MQHKMTMMVGISFAKRGIYTPFYFCLFKDTCKSFKVIFIGWSIRKLLYQWF